MILGLLFRLLRYFSRSLSNEEVAKATHSFVKYVSILVCSR
jgi:hypothetical protein